MLRLCWRNCLKISKELTNSQFRSAIPIQQILTAHSNTKKIAVIVTYSTSTTLHIPFRTNCSVFLKKKMQGVWCVCVCVFGTNVVYEYKKWHIFKKQLCYLGECVCLWCLSLWCVYTNGSKVLKKAPNARVLRRVPRGGFHPTVHFAVVDMHRCFWQILANIVEEIA